MKYLTLLAFVAAPPAFAQDTAESALARQVLSAIQPRSIAENREYCGYIGLDDAGRLVASAATPGNEASCLADDPTNIAIITASWHTHAAYSPDYDSEIPSGDDIEGDEAEGIDGYVATPGGRFWYIDTTDDVLSQLCGIGCLPSDPRFVAGDFGVIEQSYSFSDLIRLLDG